MSVLNFSSPTPSTPFGHLPSAQGTEKPKSKIWLSVGREINGVFISLPLDQGIDTMRPSEVRGQNEDFVKRITAQNDFLASLQKVGAGMQPGQEVVLNLQVRLRRVNEQLVIDRRDNEFTIDPTTLLVAAE